LGGAKPGVCTAGAAAYAKTAGGKPAPALYSEACFPRLRVTLSDEKTFFGILFRHVGRMEKLPLYNPSLSRGFFYLSKV